MAKWMVAVLFLMAFLLRLHPLGAPGWDEAVYLQHAEVIAFGKDNYDELAFRPPMLSILLAGIFLVWHSTMAAEVFTALGAASVVIAAYLLGSHLFGTRAGLFAALLAAVHPLLVSAGGTVMTDAVLVSLLAFAIVLAIRDTWWTALLSGVLTGMAALTKFTGFIALPLLAAWCMWERPFPWTRARLLIIGSLAVVGPYFIWAEHSYGGYLATIARAQAILPNTGPPAWYYAGVGVVSLAMLLGLLLHNYREHRNYHLFTLVWFAAFVAYLSWLPHKEPRFGLIAIVPLFPLAGAGFARLCERMTWKHLSAAALCGLILLMSLPAFERLDEPFVHPWEPDAVKAAQFIRATGQELPIYATTHFPVFAYETHSQVINVHGPGFLRAYPLNMPRDGFLIISTGGMQEPTPAWAASQDALSLIYTTESMSVYYYNR